jgi:predicted RNA binding protein YcfA (HicA-like mRNA interferase family)
VSPHQKLRAKVLSVPVEMRFSEIKQVLEDAGWTHSRTVGSHHQFTKPGMRTLVVPEHGGKVKQATIRQVAKNV